MYMFYILSLPSAFYLLYAKLEEECGLARHAMSVYERATKAVLPEEQFDVCHVIYICKSHDYHVIPLLQMFTIYIKRAADVFGITNTREIYEKAIEVLEDKHAR